jgi:hypothetical protein
MKNYIAVLLASIITFAAFPACAAFDADCVSQCLATNHECHYCAYQCRVEPKEDVLDLPDRIYDCPLEGFEE